MTSTLTEAQPRVAVSPLALSPEEVADRHFLDARGKLLDVAAYLDRVERVGGVGALEEYRTAALLTALAELSRPGGDRTARLLLALSDPSTDPIPSAGDGKAHGAWRPASRDR